jgi:rod shape-determining protein MreD
MNAPVRKESAESATYVVLLVATALASRVWFDNLHLFGPVRIDLALIFLSYLAILRGVTFGVVAGMLLGLIVDAVHPAWMGASSIGFAAVGYFAGSFGQTLYLEKSLARGLLVIGAVVLFDIIFGMLSVGMASPLWLGAVGTIGSALLSGALALVVSWLYRQWRGRVVSEPEAAGRA